MIIFSRQSTVVSPSVSAYSVDICILNIDKHRFMSNGIEQFEYIYGAEFSIYLSCLFSLGWFPALVSLIKCDVNTFTMGSDRVHYHQFSFEKVYRSRDVIVNLLEIFKWF